ncbi:hypothetical protein GQX74_002168 [Glossina fuscipes]|nr:hypothetical protein GQX74_002168 [Glossina fuscipes]
MDWDRGCGPAPIILLLLLLSALLLHMAALALTDNCRRVDGLRSTERNDPALLTNLDAATSGVSSSISRTQDTESVFSITPLTTGDEGASLASTMCNCSERCFNCHCKASLSSDCNISFLDSSKEILFCSDDLSSASRSNSSFCFVSLEISFCLSSRTQRKLSASLCKREISILAIELLFLGELLTALSFKLRREVRNTANSSCDKFSLSFNSRSLFSLIARSWSSSLEIHWDSKVKKTVVLTESNISKCNCWTSEFERPSSIHDRQYQQSRRNGGKKLKCEIQKAVTRTYFHISKLYYNSSTSKIKKNQNGLPFSSSIKQ